MWLDVKRLYCCHLEVDEFPIAARSGVVISLFKKMLKVKSYLFFFLFLYWEVRYLYFSQSQTAGCYGAAGLN